MGGAGGVPAIRGHGPGEAAGGHAQLPPAGQHAHAAGPDEGTLHLLRAAADAGLRWIPHLLL